MEQIRNLSPAKVIEEFRKMGASPKKLDSLAFMTEESPLSGKIIGISKKPSEYEGNKYLTFDVETSNGQIKKLSINRLFDQEVTDKFLIVGNEAHKGMAMLKSVPISGNIIRDLGNSQAERISAVIGKTYTAERVSGTVLVKYTPEKLFIKPSIEGEPSKEELEKLHENTAVSDRLFKFLTIQ